MRAAATEVEADMAVLAEAVGAAFDGQPLEELQIDYTRLFLNPTGPLASPYESAWLAGRDPMFVGEITQSVLDTYRQGGYDVDVSFRDLPDHIAAELEFLYTLVFREARAAASGNDADRAAAIDLRRRFIEQHLGRWVGPFTEALREGGETALYRALADLTERFVESERA
jgi:TorA maturation chaperone TorD